MTVTIRLKEEKGRLTCDIPITADQWFDILNDKEITSRERLWALLAFYYMPDHQATCKQCVEKYGQNINVYNSAVTSFGKAVIKKIGMFRIEDTGGNERFWPVAVGEGRNIKGDDGMFQWTLRPQFVEALRKFIINDALSKYTADFDEEWKREEYKWKALKTFRENWDMDAPDFADMLSRAFARHKKLLASSYAFPKGALVEMAQSKPEIVWNMFRNLYNETLPFESRIADFIGMADEGFFFGEGKKHYQSTNAVSVYLWSRYPEKYYIYKWGEYNEVAGKIGFDNAPKATGLPEEVTKGYDMYGLLQEAFAMNKELLDRYSRKLNRAPDEYFRPGGLAALTADFGFWISRYYTTLISRNPETLTDMSSNPQWQELVDNAIMNGDNGSAVVSDPETSYGNTRYWWLVASPKYWSFADLKVGGKVEYTVKNANGNRRRVPVNFDQAKAGDIVIGYEANPVKKIVALAKVVRASDGETISYEKTEELENPVSWFDFKDLPELGEMEFIRNKNGSFFKLTKNEYEVLLNLIRQENPEPENNPIQTPSDVKPYSKEQFLEEVFMTTEAYDNLTTLLRLKKNVILQGAPGVGKTFSAKRIAYSMMGEKDESRIEMVQFHQNFSYEDFIMGFKPTENGGFELRNGLFYNFCKRAEANPGEDYFFIIDEINRGNLSKIFGELLMLIENGYRGRQIKIAYRNELFSVPENLYIIGMMNTADRSLAMIDYALRRRFSFYPMRPGFDTDGFRKEMAGHSDSRVEKVVNAVMQLNDKIANDDSLGDGFCIGHSYFCGQPKDVPWIEQVVNYDICPMLDEYWFDSREKCQVEKDKLRALL